MSPLLGVACYYARLNAVLTVGQADPDAVNARAQNEGTLSQIQAADQIVTVVREFGLRRAEIKQGADRPIQPDDVGVVVYQVVCARS